MKTWEEWIEEQRGLCEARDVAWTGTDREMIVGVADNVLTSQIPVNGLRLNRSEGTSGWYVWSGTELSNSPDFFKPRCAEHLLDLNPELLKFLGLPVGYRFLYDDSGFVDVWFDENLLHVDGLEEIE